MPVTASLATRCPRSYPVHIWQSVRGYLPASLRSTGGLAAGYPRTIRKKSNIGCVASSAASQRDKNVGKHCRENANANQSAPTIKATKLFKQLHLDSEK